ncbi:hypothetical protein [Aldersonia kunmingensis]|uniref:hypothetical protein n=1 Tax=Aldersonia kunmingensis TaxID=408066 RepID=UPI00082A509D|nr:hypothetical protein [Aldersonia kunmingensis]
MKVSKISVTAALAATAVAVAAGTASAAPAPVSPAAPAVVSNTGFHGTDHGVSYRTFLNETGREITTTVDAGTFALAGDTVTLTDRSGVVVASIPLAYEFAGQHVSVAPAIADAGRTLNLAPDFGRTDVALKSISTQDWFNTELNNAAPTGIFGALIGGAIGLLVGGVGAIPGAIIGALVGLYIGGGQPLLDSGSAVLSGN